jgi:hypothetical protein
MGVGTNVQTRLVALHHLDAPWRPADLEQREGRILRPGNQNPEVSIVRYVTQGSFDVYMWQTLERKATFIGQLQSARLDERSIDDITTDTALSYGEVKALATGDPTILERAQLESELARLKRLEAGWRQERTNVARRITTCTRRISELDHQIDELADAVAIRVPTRGDQFTSDVEGVAINDRMGAGTRLFELVDALGDGSTIDAYIGGFEWRVERTEDLVRLTPGHPALPTLTFETDEWMTISGVTLVRRIESAVDRLEPRRDLAIEERSRMHDELIESTARRDTPWPHRARIEAVRERVEALTPTPVEPQAQPGAVSFAERHRLTISSPSIDAPAIG